MRLQTRTRTTRRLKLLATRNALIRHHIAPPVPASAGTVTALGRHPCQALQPVPPRAPPRHSPIRVRTRVRVCRPSPRVHGRIPAATPPPPTARRARPGASNRHKRHPPRCAPPLPTSSPRPAEPLPPAQPQPPLLVAWSQQPKGRPHPALASNTPAAPRPSAAPFTATPHARAPAAPRHQTTDPHVVKAHAISARSSIAAASAPFPRCCCSSPARRHTRPHTTTSSPTPPHT